MNVIKVVGVTK